VTTEDYLLAVASVHTAAIIGLAIYITRTREIVARLQEWARLIEKRINGNDPR
jgi:hypothetical protein